MNQIAHRLLSSAILMVWGSVMVFMFFSGRVENYLAPSFRIYTAVCGGVLIVLAFTLLVLPEAVRAQDLAGCANSFTRSLGGHVAVAVFLVGALLAAVVVSPSQFGAAMVINRGYVDVVSALPGRVMKMPDPALPGEDPAAVGGEEFLPSDYLARNENGQIIAEALDLLYAAQEPTLRPDFENQEIEVIGQFMPAGTDNPGGDRFKLVRMMMMCCAADARPVAVNVELAGPLEVPEMTWVKVLGTATFPLEGGRQVPLVKAVSVERTSPPEDLFIY